MARLIPPNPALIGNQGERTVFERLNLALDDEWYLFHGLKGVDNSARYRSRQWDADVVAFHPAHGLVVFEVKTGGLSLRDGVWAQAGKPMETSPVDQVRDTAGALMRLILRRTELKLPRACVLACPTHEITVQPAGAVEEVHLLSRRELVDAAPATLTVAVGTIVKSGRMKTDLDMQSTRRVVRALSPQIEAAVSPRLEIKDGLAQLESLTGEVLEATAEQLSAMETVAIGGRVCLLGGAGTGKTLIGLAAAKAAASRGESVLFVTGGGVLHSAVEAACDGSGVVVRRFDDVIADLALALGAPAPQPPLAPSRAQRLDFEREQRRILELFAETLPASGSAILDVDRIVFDEAQAQLPGTLELLATVASLEREVRVLLLADSAQRLEAGVWHPPSGYLSLQLMQNCRNSDWVSYLAGFVSGSAGAKSRVPGVGARLRIVDSDESSLTPDLIRLAQAEVGFQLDSGVEDVVVLTHGYEAPDLADALAPTRVESIFDFRGSEADGVVAVLPRAERNPLYVAVTRARMAISVVAHAHAFAEADHEGLRRAVGLDGGPTPEDEALRVTLLVDDAP